ncbi:hypothetical protein [Olsenella sp. Marseille-P4559]|uniref:hypothetical protein n=1 Tax=Olsenella sp. Marseille-P4559 TaxID=2364795 RepID=UPI001A916DC4|nr:hypothetical protein [Olsenella sp. Marseille-P4559]
MKTYRYEQAKFNVSVIATGMFCLVLCIVSALSIMGVADLLPAPIAVLVLIVASYQVWNTFVAIANPQDVIIDEDSITFGAFGRRDRFAFADIKSFNVREVGGNARIYVRVNGGGLLRGRYWLQTLYMSDGEELFQWMEDFEYRVEPDSLKARARRSSEIAAVGDKGALPNKTDKRRKR